MMLRRIKKVKNKFNKIIGYVVVRVNGKDQAMTCDWVIHDLEISSAQMATDLFDSEDEAQEAIYNAK